MKNISRMSELLILKKHNIKITKNFSIKEKVKLMSFKYCDFNLENLEYFYNNLNGFGNAIPS